MAIIKAVCVDDITVVEDGSVQYRVCTKLIEDDEELAKTYERYTLTPGADLSTAPERVQRVCDAVWTPEVIAAYMNRLDQFNRNQQES